MGDPARMRSALGGGFVAAGLVAPRELGTYLCIYDNWFGSEEQNGAQ